MGGVNPSDGFHKARTPLEDVSNKVEKRGFSSVSATSGLKSSDGCNKIVEIKGDVSQIAKPVCPEGEILEKVQIRTNSSINDNTKAKWAGVAPIPRSISVPVSLCDSNLVETGVTRDDDDEGRVSSEATESDPLDEQVATDEDKEAGNDDLVADSVSFDCCRFPESQEPRFSEGEKCTGYIKGDCNPNHCEDIDSIKGCTCSFCTKAAYIWSDLQYQDIKGRLAALKKIQKDTNSMILRSYKKPVIENNCQGNSNRLSKIESDLTGQWRSLFLHMEDIFVLENSQLEASLLTLQELRENCRTKLASSSQMPSEAQ